MCGNDHRDSIADVLAPVGSRHLESMVSFKTKPLTSYKPSIAGAHRSTPCLLCRAEKEEEKENKGNETEDIC